MLGTVLEGAWSIIIRFKLELRVNFYIFCFFTIFLFKGPTEDLEKLLESDDGLSEAGDDLAEAGDVLAETDPEGGNQLNDPAELLESDNRLSEIGVDLAETDPEAGHQLNDLAEESSLQAHMRRFSICSLADAHSPAANSTVCKPAR